MAKSDCVCTHINQDKLNGKQIRIFNQTNKEGGSIYRCTVCSREKKIVIINLEKVK